MIVGMGNLLTRHVGREVPIEVGDRTGKAKLCRDDDRAKTKRYFFRVAWDAEPAATETEAMDKRVEGEKKGKGAAGESPSPALAGSERSCESGGNEEEW